MAMLMAVRAEKEEGRKRAYRNDALEAAVQLVDVLEDALEALCARVR